MAETVRMVCLANSRKRSGRCIAGMARFADGSLRWARPVSNRPDGAVSHQERRISGVEPELLDILEISLAEPRPHQYQTENWLLDGSKRWRLVGHAECRQLARLANEPTSLWMN
jgi:hypothetical protein